MNLADIRNAVFHQADWGPKQSPEAKERMNVFVNRAYNLIALEAPFLFFEDILEFATEPDVIPDEANSAAPVNVLNFTKEVHDSGMTHPSNDRNSWNLVQQNSGDPGVIVWPTDRSWDGRVIEIKDSDGVWHRNIIRTIWNAPIEDTFATATVTVNNVGGSSFVQNGDWIEINNRLPLTCTGGAPAAGANEFQNNITPNDLAANIAGPPVVGPANGGFNDGTNFDGVITADIPGFPNNVVELTSVLPGAQGNEIPINYVSTASGSVGSITVTPFTGGKDHHFLSIWIPWDTKRFGSGPFEYRIYTEEYALPDDVIQVNSTRLWETNNTWPLSVISQYEAEQLNILNTHNNVAKGIPRTMFRRTHYQMPAPAVPPHVMPFVSPAHEGGGGQHGWVGPDPAGTFEYKITYCWGARDIWFRNPGPHHWGANATNPVNQLGERWDAINGNERWGQQRYREPRWESAPSPVSAQVITTNKGESISAGNAALLRLPNIEYIQGFYWNLIVKDTLPSDMLPPATDGHPFKRQHAQKSGWFTRIYRRRVSTDFTDYSDLGTTIENTVGIAIQNPDALVPPPPFDPHKVLHKIEEDTSFYLLSEIHIDPLNEGLFMDDGQLLPDYHRRLRDTHGYMNIGLYPNPDKRYVVEVRCLRRPRPLTNDTDAPYIHAEACDILIDRTLQLLYESEGNRPMMKSAKERYERCLVTLTKRYGDLRPEAVAVRRRLVRASRGRSIRNPLRGSGGTSLPFP